MFGIEERRVEVPDLLGLDVQHWNVRGFNPRRPGHAVQRRPLAVAEAQLAGQVGRDGGPVGAGVDQEAIWPMPSDTHWYRHAVVAVSFEGQVGCLSRSVDLPWLGDRFIFLGPDRRDLGPDADDGKLEGLRRQRKRRSEQCQRDDRDNFHPPPLFGRRLIPRKTPR